MMGGGTGSVILVGRRRECRTGYGKTELEVH